jgi:hypothetical protein
VTYVLAQRHASLAETAAPSRRSTARGLERRLGAAACRQEHIHNNAEQFVTPPPQHARKMNVPVFDSPDLWLSYRFVIKPAIYRTMDNGRRGSTFAFITSASSVFSVAMTTNQYQTRLARGYNTLRTFSGTLMENTEQKNREQKAPEAF